MGALGPNNLDLFGQYLSLLPIDFQLVNLIQAAALKYSQNLVTDPFHEYPDFLVVQVGDDALQRLSLYAGV